MKKILGLVLLSAALVSSGVGQTLTLTAIETAPMAYDITQLNESGLSFDLLTGDVFQILDFNNPAANILTSSMTSNTTGAGLSDTSPLGFNTNYDVVSGSTWNSGEVITFSITTTNTAAEFAIYLDLSGNASYNGGEIPVTVVPYSGSPVPEPSTYALLIGLTACIMVGTRRRRQVS